MKQLSKERSEGRLLAGDPPPPAWHSLEVAAVAARLGVDPARGLSAEEAARRLVAVGPNRLREPPSPSALLAFLAQFKSVLVLVLLGAAVVALVAGAVKDAVVIAAVVLLNSTMGFLQERRAEKSLAALASMLAAHCRVRRQGRAVALEAAALVPGDVLLLEAGDRVAADGRVLLARTLEVDEAALTGESHPVEKSADLLCEPEAALGDRRNLAFMNTIVTRGRGELLVTGTGMSTELGRVAELLAASKPTPTPLQVQLDTLGKRLGALAMAVVAVVLTAELVRGSPVTESLMLALALAVAAIPEGLPAVVTVTLAIGMRRMAGVGAIVKRLAAVETLGSTTVICSDKTGTLTLNQMTVRTVIVGGQRYAVDGEGYSFAGGLRPLAAADAAASSALDLASSPAPAPLPAQAPVRALCLAAALCGDSHVRGGVLLGDPTEGALVVLAGKGGVTRETAEALHPRLAEVPFESAHKLMATFHAAGDSVRIFVKGAPEALLPRCAFWLVGDECAVLDERGRAELDAENAALAQEALRVLAVAERTVPRALFDVAAPLWPHLEGLTFLGLAGLQDPPRSEAREAIAQCHRAGIAVKMITGDQAATAAAIARELGLRGGVLSGAELETLSADALGERVGETAVFARVAPEHKTRIVQALRARGEVVAMTGDGVNDAPALKGADIGVAMGSGTEVSKEAATMVLTDDNFATIVRAVREGRTIYSNIVHFVRFQLSTNIAAILTVVLAPFFGLPSPFHAIQLLWVNIIMDGPPALALGLDASRPGLMDDPPRDRDASILPWARLWRLGLVGAVMAAGTLWMLHHGASEGTGVDAGAAGAAGAGGELRQHTLAFTTFVLFQFFNAFNARVERQTAFTRYFFSNRRLWLALAVVVALQVLVVSWGPAQELMHTTALSLADWAVAVAVASCVLWVDEVRKLVERLVARRVG